jgi:HD-GYP domain-containing protein (c-di-GMP phosphodiesterase class II)
MNTLNSSFPEAFGFDLDDLLNLFSLPLRNHSRRVAICTSIMAEHAIEFLQPRDINARTSLALVAHLGGTCHDIGKLLLPVLIVEKSDYFQHPTIGTELLDVVKSLFDHETQAQMVLDMVRYHHERPDGTGFPYGLHACDIPLAAGLCALADWLDYQLCPRQEAQNSISVLREVKTQAGKQFCESAVTCFEHAWPQLMEQYEKWG